mmetsp:Transcript_117956/g.306257  ORF Transcript_117956/g.306257 Transcript_117956/m.306257 type:complete len:107 (+) Transcript_117956:578-898(+)
MLPSAGVAMTEGGVTGSDEAAIGKGDGATDGAALPTRLSVSNVALDGDCCKLLKLRRKSWFNNGFLTGGPGDAGATSQLDVGVRCGAAAGFENCEAALRELRLLST